MRPPLLLVLASSSSPHAVVHLASAFCFEYLLCSFVVQLWTFKQDRLKRRGVRGFPTRSNKRPFLLERGRSVASRSECHDIVHHFFLLSVGCSRCLHETCPPIHRQSASATAGSSWPIACGRLHRPYRQERQYQPEGLASSDSRGTKERGWLIRNLALPPRWAGVMFVVDTSTGETVDIRCLHALWDLSFL